MNYSRFSIHFLTLSSQTIVHNRFNDNWLFVSFFYYCHYYFSLLFHFSLFFLVLFFIKWLYIDLLTSSFCKYISSHPTSIFPKLLLLLGALLFTLSISLNKFLLVAHDPRYETLDVPGDKRSICYILLGLYCYIYIYIYIYIYKTVSKNNRTQDHKGIFCVTLALKKPFLQYQAL